MSSRRRERLEEIYRRTVSAFLQRRLNSEGAVFSVTRAELSEKLDYLRIYFSLWPDQKEKDMLESLESLKRELRKELAREIKTKFVPEIEFFLDDSEKRRLKIEELLKKSR